MIRRLVAEGADVVSVDIRPQRETLAGVKYVIGDVRDLGSLSVERPISRIYNFAAVHTTPGHPTHEYYETNILGALEVTRFASRNDIRDIVFTSSISVYGPSEDTKTEDTPPKPESAYGYSKWMAERIHRQWYEDSPERRLTIVRPAVVFGAGERGNFTRMAGLLKKGLFIYPGRRDTVKSCISVYDLIEAMEYARSRPESHVLFNGSYPHRYTVEQIVGTFSRLYFPKVRTFTIPLAVVMSMAKILRALDTMKVGFHPDRVLKLVRSTDVYPEWLERQGFTYPNALEKALGQWAEETNGRFD